jgi:integrase
VRSTQPLSVYHIGHLPIRELKPAHIRECYTKLMEKGPKGKPLSKRSVQQTHTVLHTAIEQAVKEELLLPNPCDAVTAPRPERNEMRVLTLEQAQTLLQSTASDHLHPLWVTLLLTGMRVGEAIALRWGDVDLNSGTLSIQRAMQRIRGKGLTCGPVKTHRSNRRLDLPAMVVEALRAHEDR